jgi:hypothetical protein
MFNCFDDAKEGKGIIVNKLIFSNLAKMALTQRKRPKKSLQFRKERKGKKDK